MTARLILPETHHVTDGGWDTANHVADGPQYWSPRVWWWPVDGPPPEVLVWPSDPGFDDEAGYFPQSHRPTAMDDPALARLLGLTEPCATCDGKGWRMVGTNTTPRRGLNDGGEPCMVSLSCPDCHRGKRIVQLVQTCPKCDGNGAVDRLFGAACGGCSSFPYGPEGPPVSDGTVLVARVTITLLPIKNWDRDANPCDDGPFIGIYQSNRKPAEFCSPHPDGSGDWTSKPLPFHVEPGQWVGRAMEIPS